MELHSIKMLWLKNKYNLGINLANKMPQVSKTFDQYFSPVDTQINNDLTLKKLKLFINHLSATRLLELIR